MEELIHEWASFKVLFKYLKNLFWFYGLFLWIQIKNPQVLTSSI